MKIVQYLVTSKINNDGYVKNVKQHLYFADKQKNYIHGHAYTDVGKLDKDTPRSYTIKFPIEYN